MKLLDEEDYEVDEYGTTTIAFWGGWKVQVMPMLFNDRLVLAPITDPDVYDYGWCYDKSGGLGESVPIVAARLWDPWVHAEPPGYKKAIHLFGPRRAGQTAND